MLSPETSKIIAKSFGLDVLNTGHQTLKQLPNQLAQKVWIESIWVAEINSGETGPMTIAIAYAPTDERNNYKLWHKGLVIVNSIRKLVERDAEGEPPPATVDLTGWVDPVVEALRQINALPSNHPTYNNNLLWLSAYYERGSIHFFNFGIPNEASHKRLWKAIKSTISMFKEKYQGTETGDFLNSPPRYYEE